MPFERSRETALIKNYADRAGNRALWNGNFLTANAPGTMTAIPVPRIILNKERAEPQRRSRAIHFPRRYSPGILYGIRVPTELPVFPDQNECIRDERAHAHTSLPSSSMSRCLTLARLPLYFSSDVLVGDIAIFFLKT